jgi:hypothetical protein
MTDDKKGFDYKTWWDENRERVNAKRRERYASDPEYRKKQQEHTKKWKQRRRELNASQPRQRSRTMTMKLEGREVEMHTIGVFSERVGKSVITLREWERQGFIPQTPFRSSRGDRLYTDDMIETVNRIVGGRATVDLRDQVAKAAILNGWKKAGVPV